MSEYESESFRQIYFFLSFPLVAPFASLSVCAALPLKLVQVRQVVPSYAVDQFVCLRTSTNVSYVDLLCSSTPSQQNNTTPHANKTFVSRSADRVAKSIIQQLQIVSFEAYSVLSFWSFERRKEAILLASRASLDCQQSCRYCNCTQGELLRW